MACCANVLTRPAELFWNRFSAPCYRIPRDLIIADIAMRYFAFIGMMFTLPLYFMGQFLKIFCCCFLVGAAQSLQFRINLPLLPAVRNIRSDEVTSEERALTLLNELLADPTWDNYRKLPYDQQYLIAGHYTYPYFWGWSFSTKVDLLNEFQSEFQGRPSLFRASDAIREAIRYQERIIYVARFKEAVRIGGDLRALYNQDPEAYRQACHFIAREHGCRPGQDPLAFAGTIVRNRPRHRDTMFGLECLTSHLKGAYSLDRLPEMRAARS